MNDFHSYQNDGKIGARQLQQTNNMVNSKNLQMTFEISALNYICIALFLIILGLFIYILKKHLAKFVNFYIIKRDYLRMKIQNNKPRNECQTMIAMDNNKETEAFTYKKMNLAQIARDYGKALVQNLAVYHPICAIILTKVKRVKSIKMPMMISVAILIITLIILVTFDLILSKIVIDVCQESRFIANNYYICSQQSQSGLNFSSRITQISIICSLIIVILTMIGTYFITRNYFQFIRRLQNNENCGKLLTSEKENLQTDPKNLNLQTQQHQATIQNMLGDDYEFTRRSLKPAQNNNSNKNLFQINEAEDEEPFSPEKKTVNNRLTTPTINILGENRNILNTSTSRPVTQQHLKVASSKKENDCSDIIHASPQFCSVNKNDDNLDEIKIENPYQDDLNQQVQSQQNTFGTRGTSQYRSQMTIYQSKMSNYQSKLNCSSKNLLNSVCGMSENTTIIDGQNHLHNSSHKNIELEGIQEVDELRGSQQFMKQRLHDSGFYEKDTTPGRRQISQTSKEECKEEDSSRIMILKNRLGKSSEKSSSVQQPQFEVTELQLGWLLVILIIVMGLVLCSLYILYSFYNLTTKALETNLIIFAISLIFDFLILRPSAIAVMSIFSTAYHIKELKSTRIESYKMYDEEQVCLLGQIYEDYEQQYVQQNTNLTVYDNSSLMHPQIVYDDEKGLKVNNNSRGDQNQNNQLANPNIRVLNQTKRRQNLGELVLVESTFFYHQQDDVSLIKSNHPISQQSANSKSISSINNDKKKSKRTGEKVEYVRSMTFNAEDLKLQKSQTQNLNIDLNDEDNYDIEEIPMHSSRNPNKLEHAVTERIDRNFPPIINSHQQFETPKGLQGRNQISLPGVNLISDQLRASQDHRMLLKDLLLESNSSKKKKEEYHSLQRYLDDENKENNSHIKNSAHLTKSINNSQRKQNYLEKDLNQLIVSPGQHLLQLRLCNQDEVINFTPQYCSQQKSQTIKNAEINNENRKSLALPQLFSDIKNVHLSQDLQRSSIVNKSKRNTEKKSQKSFLENKENTIEGDFTVLQNIDIVAMSSIQKGASKKSFISPNSIRENLESKLSKNLFSNKRSSIQQPNISPFNDKQRDSIIEEEQHTQAEQPMTFMNSPKNAVNKSPQNKIVNVRQSLEFVRGSKASDKNMNFKQMLQPQLKKKQTKNQVINNMVIIDNPSLSNNTLIGKMKQQPSIQKSQTLADEPIASKPNNLLKSNTTKPKIKPKKEKQQQLTSEQEFTKENNFTSQSRNPLFSMEEEINNQCEASNQENSQLNDTVRSKVFEDSDQSTFRLISFNKQKNKQDYKESKTQSISSAIDFYSNSASNVELLNQQQTEEEKNEQKAPQEYQVQTQQFKANKKRSVAEIIFEENEMKNSLSPEKPQFPESRLSHQIQQPINETEPSQIQIDNGDDEDFNMLEDVLQGKTLQSKDNNIIFQNLNFQDEVNDMLELHFCKRQSQIANAKQSKPIKVPKRNASKSNQRTKSSTNTNVNQDSQQTDYQTRQQFGTNIDYQTGNQRYQQQEENRKKKEENELLLFRIQEQKRKLKHFLKLARQLKSTKDEKKIKELMHIIKETQRPLPMSKINELKLLEIMSSPYNQSLIAMIKDEYDHFNKKGDKPPTANGKKSAKSQQRDNERKEQVAIINKLSGIYGAVFGNNFSNRTKSRENSADTQQTMRNKLKDKNGSRHSSRQKPRKRNQIQVIDQSMTNQSQLNDMIVLNHRNSIGNYDITNSEEDSESGIQSKAGNIFKKSTEGDYSNCSDSVEYNQLKSFMDKQNK